MELFKRMILLVGIIGVSVCICESDSAGSNIGVAVPGQPLVVQQCKVDEDCFKICPHPMCPDVVPPGGVSSECKVVKPKCKNGKCICTTGGVGGGPGLPDTLIQVLKSPPPPPLCDEKKCRKYICCKWNNPNGNCLLGFPTECERCNIKCEEEKSCDVCKRLYCIPECKVIAGGVACPDIAPPSPELQEFCIKCKKEGKVKCEQGEQCRVNADCKKHTCPRPAIYPPIPYISVCENGKCVCKPEKKECPPYKLGWCGDECKPVCENGQWKCKCINPPQPPKCPIGCIKEYEVKGCLSPGCAKKCPDLVKGGYKVCISIKRERGGVFQE